MTSEELIAQQIEEILYTSQDQTEKILFITALQKKNPHYLILFLMLHDLEKLLKFCKAFGGQSLKIPRLSDLEKLLKESSTVANKLQTKKKLTTDEKEDLAYISMNVQSVADLSPESTLNPLTGKYLDEILRITLNSYQKFQEKLIETTDTSNPAEVKRTLDILTSDLSAQYKLMSQITDAANSVGSVDSLVNLVLNKTKKKAKK